MPKDGPHRSANCKAWGFEHLKLIAGDVAAGGVVAFDEYASAGYGESDAVDEFFRGQKIRLRSFSWAKTPKAFLVKEAA